MYSNLSFSYDNKLKKHELKYMEYREENSHSQGYTIHIHVLSFSEKTIKMTNTHTYSEKKKKTLRRIFMKRRTYGNQIMIHSHSISDCELFPHWHNDDNGCDMENNMRIVPYVVYIMYNQRDQVRWFCKLFRSLKAESLFSIWERLEVENKLIKEGNW